MPPVEQTLPKVAHAKSFLSTALGCHSQLVHNPKLATIGTLLICLEGDTNTISDHLRNGYVVYLRALFLHLSPGPDVTQV